MMWWYSAAGAVVLAVVAGVADWRRGRRVDLDRVGLINWRGLHVFALIAAVMCMMLATHQ